MSTLKGDWLKLVFKPSGLFFRTSLVLQSATNRRWARLLAPSSDRPELVTCALPYSSEDLVYSPQPPHGARSNRTRTTASAPLAPSLFVEAGGEKREKEGFWVFFPLTSCCDTLNASTGVWMLARCCQGFGQRQGGVVSSQRDFFLLLSHSKDATASAKWITHRSSVWSLWTFIFRVCLKMNERRGSRERGFQWCHLVFLCLQTQRFTL